MLWSLRSLARPVRPCLRHQPLRPFSFTSNIRFPRIKPSSSEVPPVPSFREQVARAGQPKSFAEAVQRPSIRGQVIFFLVGSFAVFSIASEQSNAETARWMKKLAESNLIWKVREPTSDDIRRARHSEFGKSLQTRLSDLKDFTEGWSQTVRGIAIWTYIQVFQPILDAADGKRVCWAIGAVNTAVWVAWQLPRLRPFMMTHFTHNPLSGMSYTLLTSMFSHKSVFHLLFNCMALASFGSAASIQFQKEQQRSPSGLQEANVTWHFLAFYLSAGLFSGMASHIMTSRFIYPQMVKRLAASATPPTTAASTAATATAVAETSAPTILPSLGASGAIYSAVTLTALAFPNTEIALLFPPSFPIPIQWGVGGLLAIDVLGALRGWRLFDHWAHLGGAAFGVWYYNYGPRMWDILRAANLGVSPDAQRPRKAPKS